MSGRLPPLRVIYEDNHLLAVAKRAGIATMGAPKGENSLLVEAKAYLKAKYEKPGEVYLGVVSRLDAPVSGVVLFARTSKAASRLTAAFRDRQVEKRYLAVVSGSAPPCPEPLVHYLKKDERNQKIFATHDRVEGVQRAELSYRPLLSRGERSLLLVRPVTGRKHQIRVQLSKIGHPILGDQKYGSGQVLKQGIALHAWRLQLEHPVRREPLLLESDPPKEWPLSLPKGLPPLELGGSDLRQ